MRYIVRKCDEIKKGMICVSLDGDDKYKTVIRPFPETEYVSSFAEFAAIYLTDNSHLAVRNISIDENDDEYRVIVSVYYITKDVLKITDGVEEFDIKINKKAIEKVSGFDYLKPYIKEYNENNKFETKYRSLYSKMFDNNEKIDKLNEIIVNHKPNETVNLDGIMSFDEFEKYLENYEEFFKSNMYFDNEYISKTYNKQQLIASYTLFLSLISFSTLAFVNDEKISNIAIAAGITPILLNAVINLSRHYTASKMYKELLSASGKSRTKNKKIIS